MKTTSTPHRTYWDTPAGVALRKRISIISKEHRRRLPRPHTQSPGFRAVEFYNKRKRREFAIICARYNNRCVACGSDGPLTVDHVRPTALHGSSRPDNIQPLCRPCNEKKHTKIIDYRSNPHPNCLA